MISSCAKFILSGEHSVLYGHPCIAIPVKDAQLSIRVSPEKLETTILVNGKALPSQTEALVLKGAELVGLNISNLQTLNISTNIPLGSGLGSSAALNTALARLAHPTLPPKSSELAKIAMQGEKVFHGNPSGVDPYCVSLEEEIVFWSKGQGENPRVEKLETEGWKQTSGCFVLRDSGETHNTQKVIEKMQNLRANKKEWLENQMKSLGELTQKIRSAFEQVKSQVLGQLMTDAHDILCTLELETAGMREAAQSLREMGALGVKMTGAGQGGYVVGLFEKKPGPEKLRSGDFVVSW